MTFIDFILLALVACLIGAIGKAIAGFSRGGCVVSIILGFIGAVIGVWLERRFGLPELWVIHIGRTSFPVIWSIIGATLFVALVGFLSGRRS